MGLARASVIVGPAKIVRGAGIVYSKDDIIVNINRNTFDIATSAHGKVDERDLDAFVELNFTPEGRWDAATRAFLWPYASTVAGTSIIGATDTPTVITDANAHVHTIKASGISKMPSIFLSATKTMIGPATILGVRVDAADWDAAASLYEPVLSGGTFVDTTFTPSLIKTCPYTGVLGATLTEIQTEDGWTIDFDMTTTPIVVDREGTVDFRFTGLGVMARCMPVNVSAVDLMAASLVQGSGAARGRSMGSAGEDLVITGDGGPVVTLNNVGIKGVGFRFGTTVLRNGEVGFVATRTFTAGVEDALFVLA